MINVKELIDFLSVRISISDLEFVKNHLKSINSASIESRNVMSNEAQEKSCTDCRYSKRKGYHDVMYCRDCRQMDRFVQLV